MLYAKIIDGSIKIYPYTLDDLRWDYPNVSFPLIMSEEKLAEWGVFVVKETTKPIYDYKKIVKEGTPTLIEGRYWVQTWEVLDLPAHEVYNLYTKQWEVVRLQRNGLLQHTDWICARAVDTGEPVPQEWKVYRQALRDITSQEDPFNIDWPTPPQ